MDEKKQLILEILQKLQPYRDLASKLYILVNSPYCTPNLLNAIPPLIKKAIKSVKIGEEKDILQKTFNKIEQIRAMEAKENSVQQENLESLLDEDLDDILAHI